MVENVARSRRGAISEDSVTRFGTTAAANRPVSTRQIVNSVGLRRKPRPEKTAGSGQTREQRLRRPMRSPMRRDEHSTESIAVCWISSTGVSATRRRETNPTAPAESTRRRTVVAIDHHRYGHTASVRTWMGAASRGPAARRYRQRVKSTPDMALGRPSYSRYISCQPKVRPFDIVVLAR